MSYNSRQTFNPLACEKVLPPLYPSQIPSAADVALKKSDFSRLTSIYTSAIDYGMTSPQIIADKFGNDVGQKMRSGDNLNPEESRRVLKYLSSLNPDNASGSIPPSPRGRYVPVAAAPTLPNLPRRATGRQPR